ncbi:MAG: queA, partial [Caulobacteraceae bacterium]|nr:queA [Caulobacteraceae bacterium]
MADRGTMHLSDFDFDLPPESIALRPVSPRDSARLLLVKPEAALADLKVSDLPSLLSSGDALVFNDAKVIPARLAGHRFRGESRIAVEATLHRRLDAQRWSAFMRPGKKLEVGDRIRFGEGGEVCLLGALEARLESKGEGGEVVLAFDLAGPDLDERGRRHRPLHGRDG